MTVSRREALTRQLDTAVQMWFFERDPLAIHLLIMTASQCLRDLGAKLIEKPSEEMYDWLRHASSDRNDRIDFWPGHNGRLLWNAIMSFLELFDDLTPTMRAFQLYFLLNLPCHLGGGTYKNVRGFLPFGWVLNDVQNLRPLECFRKLTKGFVAEDASKPRRNL